MIIVFFYVFGLYLAFIWVSFSTKTNRHDIRSFEYKYRFNFILHWPQGKKHLTLGEYLTLSHAKALDRLLGWI